MTQPKKGTDVIKSFVETLSAKAGVYRMMDENGIVLYVGKAKNLKRRVVNYTQPEKQSLRIQRMIYRTHSMAFVETASETEALLLEADLIKTLKPYYNILLRDDKSYPEIELSFDKGYPAIKKHRGLHRKGSRYFGPFASASAVNQALTMLENVFYLGTDSQKDAKRVEYKKRYYPVLKHQFMKNFASDSSKHMDSQDFDTYLHSVIAYLEGKDDTLQEKLKALMLQASEDMDYEKASVFRDRLHALNSLQISKGVSVKGIGNSDVMAIHQSGGVVCIQVLFYRDSIACGSAVFFPRCDTENTITTVTEFIPQFYQEYTKPNTLFISADIPDKDVLETALDMRVHTPKGGYGKIAMKRAMDNAESALERHKSSVSNHVQSLKDITALLNLADVPNRIEVYDNSHTQGDNPVGAMIVVGQDGFDKKSYRTWNIQTQMTRRDNSGRAGDDYAMMREVFRRRFALDKTHQSSMPDLVVVDGGKGQLSSALQVLDDLKLSYVPVVCIAKGEKRNDGQETFHTRAGQTPIPVGTPLHYFLERIRDEAHRFAITKHRKKRDKGRLRNPLDDITGIGQKRRQALLQYFGSAQSVAGAGIDDLCKVEGISKSVATLIYQHFNS